MEIEDPAKSRLRRRRRKTCALVSAASLIAILLLLVILALTVFKARRPVTTINSVSLSDLDFSLRGLSLHLNLSLDIDLSIRNPNKVGFDYGDSSLLLDYRGVVVGEAPIPAGDISSGEAMPLNLTLTVMADRFLSNSQVITDVISGALPLSTRTSLSGKVSVLGFIHIHVVSRSTCNVSVSLASRNVSDYSCAYKTKL